MWRERLLFKIQILFPFDVQLTSFMKIKANPWYYSASSGRILGPKPETVI